MILTVLKRLRVNEVAILLHIHQRRANKKGNILDCPAEITH